KDWAFSLCLAIVAGEIMIMLLPKSNTTKIFKFVLCTFFLCVIICPFVGGNTVLDFDISSDIIEPTEQKAEDLDLIIRNQMAQQLVKVTEKYLKENGVKDVQIEVSLSDKEENLNFFETTIELLSINRDKEHIIQKELEKLLGTQVTLTFKE
ncbi:MAG: stage III sporulation protein AF, partial [Oscillospiraceae bacterium]